MLPSDDVCARLQGYRSCLFLGLSVQYRRTLQDHLEIDSQLPLVAGKPLPGSLAVRTQALYSEPELPRVVRHREVNGFVRDDVAEHGIGCENQPPVEGEIPTRRAVAPFGPLSHNVDVVGLAPKARRDRCEVAGDLRPRFSPKPAFEAAGDDRA